MKILPQRKIGNIRRLFAKIFKKNRNYFPNPLTWALIFGFSAFISGFLSLFIEQNYRWGISITTEGFIGLSDLLFNTIQVLQNRNPANAPESSFLYAIAQISAILFILTGIYGVIKKLSSQFRDFLRKWKFRVLESLGYKPAIIVGLGQIGNALINDIKKENDKKTIYAVKLSHDPETIKKGSRKNVLILENDDLDDHTLDKLPLKKGTEIFITTEKDAKNIELAGKLSGLQNGNFSNKIKGYVHISDYKMNNTLKMQDLLSADSSNIKWAPFSTPNITARDFYNQLFLNQQLGILSKANKDIADKTSDLKFSLPGKDEVFHLFIFGFGEIGQSIALHAAHFAHFESGLRPRITIFEHLEKGMNSWKTFMERYPAFTPPDLNLTSLSSHENGDNWDANHSRPGDHSYQTRKDFLKQTIEDAPVQRDNESPVDFRNRVKKWESQLEYYILQDQAVEYAVNAEYRPILTDIESCTLMDEISKRITSKKPGVKAAIVFCFEEESKNFNDSLRLQLEMARTFFEEDKQGTDLTCCKPETESIFPIPIFVHLPFEKVFTNLLKTKAGLKNPEIDRNIPVHIFGERENISSYKVVTNSEIENYAKGLRSVYETLSGKSLPEHTDFDSSDMEAVMFAEVKLKSLGITFLKRDMDSSEGIYAEYYTKEVQQVYEKWQEKYSVDNENNKKGKITIPYQLAEEIVHTHNDTETAESLLIERLSLLQKLEMVYDDKRDDNIPNQGIENVKENKINSLKSDILIRSIKRFEDYLEAKAKSKGQVCKGLDVAAEMEHNRWMGERLSKNWRFGERDTHRRQRKSFVPWKYVPPWESDIANELSSVYQIPNKWTVYEPENMKNYDRQQIPRIILHQRELGLCAFVDK